MLVVATLSSYVDGCIRIISFKEIIKYIMPPCPSYLGNIKKISAVVVVLFLTDISFTALGRRTVK